MELKDVVPSAQAPLLISEAAEREAIAGGAVAKARRSGPGPKPRKSAFIAEVSQLCLCDVISCMRLQRLTSLKTWFLHLRWIHHNWFRCPF